MKSGKVAVEKGCNRHATPEVKCAPIPPKGIGATLLHIGGKGFKMSNLTAEQVKEIFRINVCRRICIDKMDYCPGIEHCNIEEVKKFFYMIESVADINDIAKAANEK